MLEEWEEYFQTLFAEDKALNGAEDKVWVDGYQMELIMDDVEAADNETICYNSWQYSLWIICNYIK